MKKMKDYNKKLIHKEPMKLLKEKTMSSVIVNEAYRSVREEALILKNSIYPAEKIKSLEMLVEYCRAIDMSPYLQVAHIVNKFVEDKETGIKEYKDTIMPGIGQYRVKADKSGLYAGIEPPKLGPMITETIDGVTFSYPEYCIVTIKKLVGGKVCSFSHIEYWKENYATVNKNSAVPNRMWKKRPVAQLIKCAEMQVTKKAFSAEVTQHPTLEELEGKEPSIASEREPGITGTENAIEKNISLVSS